MPVDTQKKKMKWVSQGRREKGHQRRTWGDGIKKFDDTKKSTE